MILLSTLCRDLNQAIPDQDRPIQGFSIDTRTLNPGELFIAMPGQQTDGHRYVQEAERKGASAILASTEVSSYLPVLRVENSQRALTQLALAHRMRLKNTRFTAHTGSCGKTTCKAWLAKILGQLAPTYASPGNYNSEIGVPLSLLGIQPRDRFAVLELGANHPNEIETTSQWVKPEMAMITGIAPAHLEGFSTLDGVFQAKSKIYDALGAQGIAVINLDDVYAERWLIQNQDRTSITFGLSPQAQIHFSGKQLKTPAGQTEVELSLKGDHNRLNALAVAAMAYGLGIDMGSIAKGLAIPFELQGRLQHHAFKKAHVQLIDDSYNANPASVKAAIDYLANQSGIRILVLADMSELGEESSAYHQAIGHYARDRQIDRLLSFGRHSQFASEAFGPRAEHHAHKATLISALQTWLLDHLDHLDHQATRQPLTCLIKGSRASRMETVVESCLSLLRTEAST